MINPQASKQSSAYAYLSFSGFAHDPAELTKRIGLDPTDTFRIGELRGRVPAKENEWRLRSPLPKTEQDLRKHVATLLELLAPRSEQIAIEARKCACGIQLVGYFYTANYGTFLSSDQVRSIAAMSLSLDFDFYGLAADEA